MGGIIRDLQCSMDVAKMAELGRYDEEFFAYGFAWVEKGKRYYYLSNDQASVYQFAMKKMLQQQWTTAVQSYLQRIPVPSGMYHELNQQTKVKLAKQIQNQYTYHFFEAVTQLGGLTNNDSGYMILKMLQEKLEGMFDQERLHYFQAILQSTFIAKKITTGQYRTFEKWLAKNMQQMENDIVIEEQYSRTFGGFCYKMQNGEWSLYINAQISCVYEEWQYCMKEGFLVFPIFWKTYWFSAMGEGRSLRKRFQQDFIQILQDTIGEAVLSIKRLPSVVPFEVYQQKMNQLKKLGTKAEQQAFAALASYWDIMDKFW